MTQNTLNTALSKPLERLLNQLIALDEEKGLGFAPLDEKVIQLTLTDLQKTLFIIYHQPQPDKPGHFIVQTHLMGAPDTHLKMTFSDFSNLAFEQTHPPHTDPIGETFLTALQQLDVDWEEQLSHYVGDLIAFKVGTSIRQGQKAIQKTKQQVGTTLKEYLQFEINLLPTASQVHHFNQQVQQTAHHIEQLTDRIEALKATIKKAK